MPNVLVLNEIDPLSLMPFDPNKRPSFTPTDIAALLRQGDPHMDDEAILDVLISALKELHRQQSEIGRAIVLRVHSHSRYLHGDFDPQRPNFMEAIKQHFPVRSIVTVRDPSESYMSMKQHNWHSHFSPSTFEEYCRRYIHFLEENADAAMIKYEDFTDDPDVVMKEICDLLEINYQTDFQNLFDSFSFSGDSGRKGSEIKKRSSKLSDEEKKMFDECGVFYPKLQEMMNKAVKNGR